MSLPPMKPVTVYDLMRYLRENNMHLEITPDGAVFIGKVGTVINGPEHNSPCGLHEQLVAAGYCSIMPLTPFDAPGYEALANVLKLAYDQAARGKGAERHADDKPFDRQPMQDGADAFGVGGLLFQAYKKARESMGLPHDAKQRELLGAINYLAGAYIHNERTANKGQAHG